VQYSIILTSDLIWSTAYKHGLQTWLRTVDTELVEQSPATSNERCTGVKGMTYEQRLQLLNITTLEIKRQRLDLIEVYKILTGKPCRIKHCGCT